MCIMTQRLHYLLLLFTTLWNFSWYYYKVSDNKSFIMSHCFFSHHHVHRSFKNYFTTKSIWLNNNAMSCCLNLENIRQFKYSRLQLILLWITYHIILFQVSRFQATHEYFLPSSSINASQHTACQTKAESQFSPNYLVRNDNKSQWSTS